MKIKWGGRLCSREMLLHWESCILLDSRYQNWAQQAGCSLGLVIVSVGHLFHKAEHAKAPFPIWASPGFGAHEQLLQPTAVWSQPPLKFNCYLQESGFYTELAALIWCFRHPGRSPCVFLAYACEIIFKEEVPVSGFVVQV